ncbi:hypothetical protein [Catenovulum sediminis]|uniref:KfrA N-terminal DNA-binding domain-containing protein n=1 Tax=Catenovulum sediminis TaxID=1740262 RepID=A0ABV1RE48_9ALTE|nr:hypothetical protein [Catenovulum sediminis]
MSKQEQALQSVFASICELHQNGKNISVATVKNAMVIPAPLPIITKAISAFKADPQSYLKVWEQNNIAAQADKQANQQNETSNTLTLEQRVKTLEEQVVSLSNQLKQLLSK